MWGASGVGHWALAPALCWFGPHEATQLQGSLPQPQHGASRAIDCVT